MNKEFKLIDKKEYKITNNSNGNNLHIKFLTHAKNYVFIEIFNQYNIIQDCFLIKKKELIELLNKGA